MIVKLKKKKFNFKKVKSSTLNAMLFELYTQNYESLNTLHHNVCKQYIQVYFRHVYIFILFKGKNKKIGERYGQQFKKIYNLIYS